MHASWAGCPLSKEGLQWGFSTPVLLTFGVGTFSVRGPPRQHPRPPLTRCQEHPQSSQPQGSPDMARGPPGAESPYSEKYPY